MFVLILTRVSIAFLFSCIIPIKFVRVFFSVMCCNGSYYIFTLFRKAIVSTSANVSGQPGAANFSEISDEIKSAVDYIVGYRQDDMSKAAPSGIIKLGAGGLVQVIR